MDTARLIDLLDGYFDCDLAVGDRRELEELLLEYREARRAFWERAAHEAALHEWGEEHWGRATLPVPTVTSRRPVWWWVGGAIAAGLCLLAGWVRWQAVRPAVAPRAVEPAAVESAAAVLRYVSAPEWTKGGPEPSPGESLPEGPLGLVGGLATVELASGVQISLQGPAEWVVTGRNALRVNFGRATVQVPERARGFRLETPQGVFVDYGTTFAVDVASGGGTEAHLFAGKVELEAGENGRREMKPGQSLAIDATGRQITEGAANPRAFPTPLRVLGEALHAGGFEPGFRLSRGSIPTRAGEWGGDWGEMVPGLDGVTPREGQLMLRFRRADSIPSQGPSRWSGAELWQSVDVAALRRRQGIEGPLVAEARAYFNTGLAALDGTPRRFAVKLVAWQGSLRSVKRAWTGALTAPEKVLGTIETVFTADGDPTTWEPLEATLVLPPEVDAVVLAVVSYARPGRASVEAFPANFADEVSLRLHAPPQPALAGRR